MTDPYKQADRARWLRDLLCGALIGAGAILPGVSGGVLAVVFDVYRPMMDVFYETNPAYPVSIKGDTLILQDCSETGYKYTLVRN